MPPSPGHSARVRAEIFQHAARLFRLRGYAGTNIDDVMQAAGLTRGAFYAHFASKDELFAAAIHAGHGLLARLRAPGGDVAGALRAYLGRQEVVASDVYARRLGINGVPCFIVNRKYAVSGAQPPPAFVEVFNLAERDAATAAAQSTV